METASPRSTVPVKVATGPVNAAMHERAGHASAHYFAGAVQPQSNSETAVATALPGQFREHGDNYHGALSGFQQAISGITGFCNGSLGRKQIAVHAQPGSGAAAGHHESHSETASVTKICVEQSCIVTSCASAASRDQLSQQQDNGLMEVQQCMLGGGVAEFLEVELL